MWLILNMSRSEQVFFFFFFSLDERARTHTAHCNSSWKWQAVPVREHTGDSVTCGRRSASKSLCCQHIQLSFKAWSFVHDVRVKPNPNPGAGLQLRLRRNQDGRAQLWETGRQ